MRALLAIIVLLTTVCAVAAQTTKPPLAPGVPSADGAGGIAVIADGFDYREPGVVAKLLRDGEGVAVAYDAVDGDARPFMAGTSATAAVPLLPARLIPIRVVDDDAVWRRALDFVRRLPARVVVVTTPPAAARGTVEAAMAGMPERLFIVAATEARKLAAPNVLTVGALSRERHAVPALTADVILAPAAATREAPGGTDLSPRTAVEAAMLAPSYFRCVDASGLRDGADAAQAFVMRGQKGAAGAAPLLGLC